MDFFYICSESCSKKTIEKRLHLVYFERYDWERRNFLLATAGTHGALDRKRNS